MRNKAFTLVELLVVITILGILSSVAFVSYMGYSENTRDSARISNLTKLEKSLETRRAKAGEYPRPDDATEVTYLGKTIFTQGTLGTKTKKLLKFQSEGMDPKYDADYTYSVTADGDRFEIGTIMEDGENNTLGFLNDTYADGDDVALNHGNFNSKFYATKINGETHVFTLPSLVLKDKSGFEVTVNQSTDNFAITGAGGLPETYIGKSEANESVSFTPRLLYRGPNCGVETDQEIVNFIATLRDSFNSEPFLSDSTYQSVFSDYDYLRNNIDDFATLEEIGIKINDALGCHIKNFKTTDIFPTQCGYEQLNFEGVVDGFDIATQSCLFDYNGSGNAEVKAGEGFGGTQGLHINSLSNYSSSNLSYRVFTYIPTKFIFKVKTNLGTTSNSTFEFTINDHTYLKLKGKEDHYNDGYHIVETPLLKPGLYDFNWDLYKHGNLNGEFWLDDLEFTCQGGGTNCGRDLGFENGDTSPYDLLDFSGEVDIAWPRVIGGFNTTEGNYAIVSPNETGTANITYTKTFGSPTKLNFDIKTAFGTYGQLKFYINGAEYFRLGRYNYRNWGNYNEGYRRFTSPLLEAGKEYTFEWKAFTTASDKTYLDNIHFTCIGGGIDCGMDMGFEPSDDNDFYSDLSFSSDSPWIITGSGGLEGVSNVASGNFAITNPYMDGGTREMVFSKTLTGSAKFNFDIKTDFSSNTNARFYINDSLYLPIGYQNYKHYPRFDDGFETITTPLLTAGNYEFKWIVQKGFKGTERLFLDNFNFTCIDGVGINCKSLDTGFEEGTNTMADMGITFTGSSSTPWHTVSGNWEYTSGTNLISYPQTYNSDTAIVNPSPNRFENTIMELNKTLAVDSYINFDSMSITTSNSFIQFYIDGIERWRTSSSVLDNVWEAQTYPISAGNHTFSWKVTRGYMTYPYIWLDNINFTNQ